jgi:ferredoxin
VRVVIDHGRCTGHGRCYVLSAALFVDDDAGYAQVVGDGTVASEDVELARTAVRSCPERAIAIEG